MSEVPFETVRPDVAILVGPTHPKLGNKVAELLGIEPIPVEYKRFPDTEQYTNIEDNVRGQIVVAINTHAAVRGLPIESSLYTHMQMIDAAVRNHAREVIPVAPYYAGGRQDKRIPGKRAAMSAFLNLEMLQAAGASSFYTVDIHDSHAFDHWGKQRGTADQFTAQRMLANHLGTLMVGDPADYLLLSPDKGHKDDLLPRARTLGIDLEALTKYRDPDTAEISHEEITRPEVFAGRTIFMMDDQLSTGSTHLSAANTVLRAADIEDMYLAVTHASFVGNAVELLRNGPFKGIFVTDTIPISRSVVKALKGKLEVFSAAEVIADGLKKVLTGGSVSELDEDPEPVH